MGRSTSIYIGPYLRIPDTRMGSEPEEFFQMECPTHKAHRSVGEGKFCSKCGAERVNTRNFRTKHVTVMDELYKLFKRGADEFYDKLFDVTTEFFGCDYDKYCPCFIPQGHGFEPNDHLGIHQLDELGDLSDTDPLLDMLAKKLTELNVKFEYKRGVLVYSC